MVAVPTVWLKQSGCDSVGVWKSCPNPEPSAKGGSAVLTYCIGHKTVPIAAHVPTVPTANWYVPELAALELETE